MKKNNMIKSQPKKYIMNDDDLLVYEDKNNVIIKKDGEIEGTLTTPLELIDIGIKGLKSMPVNSFSPNDMSKIIDKQIELMKQFKIEYQASHSAFSKK